MVNLESAITERGTPEAKELEVAEPALLLPHLARPRSTCSPQRESTWSRWRTTTAPTTGRSAWPTPSRRSAPVRSPWSASAATAGRPSRRTGSRSAAPTSRSSAADASMREGASNVWAAGPTTPGIAAAHAAQAARAPRRGPGGQPARRRRGRLPALGRGAPGLPDRTSSGPPRRPWPTPARTSSSAATPTCCSAPGGSATPTSTTASGTSSGTTTTNPRPASSGSPSATDRWSATRGLRRGSRPTGDPLPLQGRDRADAIARLAAASRAAPASPPTATKRSLRRTRWSVRRIGPALQQRMRSSHHPGCPVPLTDLRYLQMTYVGFDGHAHTGEMVVHRDYAGRWPPSSGACTTPAGRSAGCAWSTTTAGTTTGRWRPTTPPASTAAGSPAAEPGPPTPTAPPSTSTPCRTPT